MSLHGEIKVNHEVIGYWQARRIQKEPGGTNDYSCSAKRVSDGFEVQFHLNHAYDDGAFILAGLACTKAATMFRICDEAGRT